MITYFHFILSQMETDSVDGDQSSGRAPPSDVSLEEGRDAVSLTTSNLMQTVLQGCIYPCGIAGFPQFQKKNPAVLRKMCGIYPGLPEKIPHFFKSSAGF